MIFLSLHNIIIVGIPAVRFCDAPCFGITVCKQYTDAFVGDVFKDFVVVHGSASF
jgi:hypothetical protein